MSVRVERGELFSYPCKVKVCTVNTVGAMGAGVAYVYRERFPDAYRRYQKRCKAGLLTVRDLLVQRNGGEWWILFPTKEDWRNDSRLEWIAYNLERLALLCTQYRVGRLVMPWLGCRNGGLRREDVWPLIESTFTNHTTEVIVLDR